MPSLLATADFMGGRVAMTVQIPTSSYTAKIMASPQAKLLNASSYAQALDSLPCVPSTL